MTKKEQKQIGQLMMTCVEEYEYLTMYIINHKTKKIEEVTDEPINLLIKVMTIPDEELADTDIEVGQVTDDNLLN